MSLSALHPTAQNNGKRPKRYSSLLQKKIVGILSV